MRTQTEKNRDKRMRKKDRKRKPGIERLQRAFEELQALAARLDGVTIAGSGSDKETVPVTATI